MSAVTSVNHTSLANSNLEPFFKGSVSIKNGTTELFKKTFSSFQEAKTFVTQYGKESVKRGFSAVCLFIPMRTDSLKNFVSDLFFPLLKDVCINETHGLPFPTIAKIMAIVVDIFTFIPRLISAPVRAIYNQVNPPHPLIKLIKNSPHFSEAMESDYTTMEIDIERREIGIAKTDEPENGFKVRIENTIKGSINIVLQWSPRESYIERINFRERWQIYDSENNCIWNQLSGDWSPKFDICEEYLVKS